MEMVVLHTIAHKLGWKSEMWLIFLSVSSQIAILKQNYQIDRSLAPTNILNARAIVVFYCDFRIICA